MTIIDDEQKLGKLLKKATPLQKSRLYTYGLKFLSKKKQTRDNSTIKQEYDLSAYQYLLTKKIWNEKNLEDLCYIRIINGTLENNNSILADFNYGNNFVACVSNQNIFGTQFHPEKSVPSGIILLKNFYNWKGE